METETALATINETKDLTISRPPTEVLAEARRAAIALNDVIAKKGKKVVFNGEQYLEFDDWQTIGKFYGLLVRTRDVSTVEIEGIMGAKAFADVYDVKSGQVVGSAEAYCMRDEKNWQAKPWFQLASMAQTRAGAKALRNCLSWVVVLAGYKTTPAEEMTGEEHHTETKYGTNKKNTTGRKISEAQQKRLYAIWKSAGKTNDEVKSYLADHYGIETTADILMDDYDNIVTWAQAK